VGATISAKKLFLCVPEVLVIGQLCTYARRTPDTSKVAKIKNWPPCSSRTEVRSFLGTTGTVHNWIEDYAHIAHLLMNLTQINVPFIWDTTAQQAMDALKNAIVSCLAICLTDYRSQDKVILAVDSSNIACGWILLQICNGEHYPSRFGSITWNERESRYSQAKIELYSVETQFSTGWYWPILQLMTTRLHNTTSPSCTQDTFPHSRLVRIVAHLRVLLHIFTFLRIFAFHRAVGTHISMGA
jgi:hypothetical protein